MSAAVRPGWDEKIACLIAVAAVALVLCDALLSFDWMSATHQLEQQPVEELSHENVLAHKQVLACSGNEQHALRQGR